FAKGPSLADVMKKRMEPARVARLVRQLLAGLDHAHAANLIHRDLKPANIMIETSDSGEEIARIVDFGIAVIADPDQSPGGKLTSTGEIIGTPLYMAPEQAKGDPIDHRVDLYALGATMWEMLAGV